MSICVGVPTESARRERRVALVPDGVKALVRLGIQVAIEAGAGARAYFPDAAYAAAGATVVDAADALWRVADIIVKVQRPSVAEAELAAEGSTLVGLLTAPLVDGAGDGERKGEGEGEGTATDPVLAALAARGIAALALERVPRITRAQAMDVLSSQATVAGYKAVLIAASQAAKLFPMLTTAAGSLAPAKVFVVGAGVAGLQAIATARRLGAVVTAFDVRAAAREQVQSLGATFVASDVVSADAEVKGGYARAQTEEEQRRTAERIAAHVAEMDVVITTAQVPGRRAPRIITAEMVRSMRPGSVVVDLAAEAGGNCALTRPGETVEDTGVTIVGPLNVASTVPFHASQMFSKNVVAVLQHLIKDGAVSIDPADEITGAMLVTSPPAVKTA